MIAEYQVEKLRTRVTERKGDHARLRQSNA